MCCHVSPIASTRHGHELDTEDGGGVSDVEDVESLSVTLKGILSVTYTRNQKQNGNIHVR